MKKRLALVLAIVMTVLLLTGCGKGGDYKAAMSLYESGQFEEAAAKFTELGDYENSPEMVKVCKLEAAKALFDAGNFEEAKSAFEELGDYENSPELAKKSGYEAAKVLFDAGKFEEAKKLFQELGDYEDCGTYVTECDYKQASALLDAGEYEAAIAIFETIRDYGDSSEKLDLAAQELMREKYGNVLDALDGNAWYFNGGADTILNRISFSGGTATIAQVYFDGNGKHDNGSADHPFTVNDRYVVVSLADGSELQIAYAFLGDTFMLGDKEYFTIEEIDAGLQGYWNMRNAETILGMKTATDKNIYINNGNLKSESASLKAGSRTGEYYYYGPYSGTYKLNFGGFDTDMSHGSEWFFNIIGGKVTLLNYDHVCTPSSKLPGQYGYKF